MSFFLGILIGGLSGYLGGTVDMVIQPIIELLRALPTLAMDGAEHRAAVGLACGRTDFAIVLILSIVGWTSIARVVRGRFFALRDLCRRGGTGRRQQSAVFRYLLPSFLSCIIARPTLAIPQMILGETALSFIGLGLQPPAISWGVLLKDAQAIRVLALSPWLLLPTVFVVVSILAFNFVGDGLRDASDPYTHL